MNAADTRDAEIERLKAQLAAMTVRAQTHRTGAADLQSQRDRLRASLLDFSKMAMETTDHDPAYQRAYAEIAKYVRETATAALSR